MQQSNYHWLGLAPSTKGKPFAAQHQHTLPPSRHPLPFRRTWKIVRSEIALDTEPPTSNDGACTIMSAPHYPSRTSSSSSSSWSSSSSFSSSRSRTSRPPRRHALNRYETPCIVWLDWRGYHARFSCIYDTASGNYSRFVIDKASIDPPVPYWRVDIRFYQGLKCAGWRVRDENGEWYMVLNIELDEGWGVRRGKAYGKFMGVGVGDEDVVMSYEEGVELGCLVGLKTVEEQREMVERVREISRLERALQQVRDLMKMTSEEVQRLGDDEVADEETEHEGKKEEYERIQHDDKERNKEMQERKEKKDMEEKKNTHGRMKFQFPPSTNTRVLGRKYCL